MRTLLLILFFVFAISACAVPGYDPPTFIEK